MSLFSSILEATTAEPGPHFVAQGFAILALLVLAGILTARVLLREGEPAEADPARDHKTLLVGLAWGTGVIPTVALVAHLFLGLPVSRTLLVACALLNGAVSGAFLLRRHGELPAWRALLAPAHLRSHLGSLLPILAAALAVAALYALKHDSTLFFEACTNRSVAIAAGWDFTDQSLLYSVQGDTRLGNTGVMAAFAVLFYRFSERALSALCGALLALGGYVLGASLSGRPAWGWAAALILSLSPGVAAMPGVDANLLTMAFSTPLFACLTARRGGWGAAGAFFGLVVLMRHVMLPALPAMLALAALRSRSLRAVGSFALVFFVMTLPMHVHHYLAMESVLAFETNRQFPALGYSFFGLDFEWRGLLNWPLHEQLVRTPHNPFPMLVGWPVHLAANLGLLGFGAMLLGFVAIWRRSATQGLFWLLWSAPIYALLMLQEAWDYPNKMGVIIVLFGAFTAWIVAGARFVLERPRAGIPILAGLALATHLAAGAAATWQVPEDTRYYSLGYVQSPRGHARDEPHQVRHAAQLAADIGLLPGPARWARYGPLFERSKLSDLDCADDKRWGSPTGPPAWGLCEIPDRGAPVTIELDLSEPPYDRGVPVRLSDKPPHVDLSELRAHAPDGVHLEVAHVYGVETPWSSRPVTLLAGVADVTGLVVSFKESPWWAVTGSPRPTERQRDNDLRCYALARLLKAMSRCVPDAVEELASPVIRLRVPSGGLTIGLEVNLVANNMVLRKGTVSREGVKLSAPFAWWHN